MNISITNLAAGFLLGVVFGWKLFDILIEFGLGLI